MQKLISLYERFYIHIVSFIGVLVLVALAFFLGFARASPKSVTEIVSTKWNAIIGLFQEAWTQDVSPEPAHFLQPSRKPGAGVTVNERSAANDVILLTGFFRNDPGLELIQRDGTVLASWRARVMELLAVNKWRASFPKTNWNIDLHGAFIEPDGSVVFNFEYQGAVKLSRCGEVLWTLPELNHHTISPASAGGYWIAGRRLGSKPNDATFWPLATPERKRGRIEDDLILHVSADGKPLESRSLFEILMDNGLEALLTANGTDNSLAPLDDGEILHLNSIVELTDALAPAFPQFAAGDLVVSVRDLNLVLVLDPKTWKVKWRQIGPWIRQHNARFMSDGTISVFNNNLYTNQLAPNAVSDLSAPHQTNILAVDPKTRQSHILYGSKPGQEMLSVVRGFHQEMPGGGLLITEPEAGRAFEVDGSGRTVWEFINRYDDTRVIEMTSATAFPASYFTVADWSCP